MIFGCNLHDLWINLPQKYNLKLKFIHMNRFVLSLATVFATVTLFSCGAQKQGTSTGNPSSNTSAASGPSASDWKSAVKGTWTLNTIDRENLPSSFTIKSVFEEAPAECFVGSTWNFIGNGKGSITFNAQGTLCAPGASREIFWSIYNPGKGLGEPQFQFKKIYAGDKAKNVTTGYRLDLSYSDGNKLVMRMPLTVANGEAYLVFNFTRSN
jgi:Lipocalin-like domain